MTIGTQLICETPLAIGVLEDALQKHFKTQNTIESFDAKEIGAGKGFTSVMTKIILNWSKEEPNLPKSVVVKIPSMRQMDKMTEHTVPEGEDDTLAMMKKFAELCSRSFTRVRISLLINELHLSYCRYINVK
jgi:hypothetical protein